MSIDEKGGDRSKVTGSSIDIEYGARCTRTRSTPRTASVHSGVASQTAGPRVHARVGRRRTWTRELGHQKSQDTYETQDAKPA